tara:strand:+ start:91 stop:639 length:549 start_codon:yes stop_codon:yes gene_type:complete
MTRIRTLFIFEILGKPAGHIKESLSKMVDQLGEQKKLEIVRREIHEPKLVEGGEGDSEEKKKLVEQELYSTFAEVEIETNDITIVMSIVLNMLPSHVEILEPTNFSFSNHDLSGLMSELTVKMHKFDEVTKVLMLERNELLKRLHQYEGAPKVNEGEVVGEKEESIEEEKGESGSNSGKEDS